MSSEIKQKSEKFSIVKPHNWLFYSLRTCLVTVFLVSFFLKWNGYGTGWDQAYQGPSYAGHTLMQILIKISFFDFVARLTIFLIVGTLLVEVLIIKAKNWITRLQMRVAEFFLLLPLIWAHFYSVYRISRATFCFQCGLEFHVTGFWINFGCAMILFIFITWEIARLFKRNLKNIN